VLKHHAMNKYWGSGGTAPRILDLGSRWEVSGRLHAPAALPQEKEPPVPIGPQSRSGHGGEEKNSQPSPGIEP
jgi:hypothetical protein